VIPIKEVVRELSEPKGKDFGRVGNFLMALFCLPFVLIVHRKIIFGKNSDDGVE